MRKIHITEKQFERLYESITESNSAIAGMKKNSANKFLPIMRENSIISEGIDWEVDNDLRAGTIVFSTDVNATSDGNGVIVPFIKKKLTTIKNRLTATSKIDKIADKHNLVGWTIGHNYNGRYKAKNGKIFSEKSLTLDIVGVTDDDMISIATDVCREFNQECVLLKLNSGKVYFVNPT